MESVLLTAPFSKAYKSRGCVNRHSVCGFWWKWNGGDRSDDRPSFTPSIFTSLGPREVLIRVKFRFVLFETIRLLFHRDCQIFSQWIQAWIPRQSAWWRWSSRVFPLVLFISKQRKSLRSVSLRCSSRNIASEIFVQLWICEVWILQIGGVLHQFQRLYKWDSFLLASSSESMQSKPGISVKSSSRLKLWKHWSAHTTKYANATREEAHQIVKAGACQNIVPATRPNLERRRGPLNSWRSIRTSLHPAKEKKSGRHQQQLWKASTKCAKKTGKRWDLCLENAVS